MSATYAADAFAGQVVLVTGGAQGIGLAIVSAFARLGAEVTIADVQLPQAQAAAQTLRDEGGSVQALACDLAEPGQIAELVAAVGERHQRLDVVIHNAAYFPLTPFAAIDAALLQRTLSVNLMAPFFLAQAALPWMRRAGGGSLLVTSSVTGPRVAYPGLAHYAASKAGVGRGGGRRSPLRCRSGGWGNRKTSPRRWCFSPRRRRPTSPARRWWWTAVRCCRKRILCLLDAAALLAATPINLRIPVG